MGANVPRSRAHLYNVDISSALCYTTGVPQTHRKESSLMIIRKAAPLAVCALAAGSLGTAHAQGSQAPFTIRRPAGEGVVVKMKQEVQIPRGSIKPGSHVAFFVDDKFIV